LDWELLFADFIELVKFDEICSIKFFEDGVRGRDFFSKKYLPRIKHLGKFFLETIDRIHKKERVFDERI